MKTCIKMLKFTFFFNLKIIFRIIGALQASTDMSSLGSSKIAAENCCTSVSEYSYIVYPRLCAHVLYVCSAHVRGITQHYKHTTIFQAPDDDHIRRNT
jgi:hypothetical protein